MTVADRLEIFAALRTVKRAERIICFRRRCSRHSDNDRSDLRLLRSAKLLGEADEKPLGSTDVAEPIDVFVVDDVTHEQRTTSAEPFKRLIDVIDGEHDAKIAERVDRGGSVVGDDGWPEEAGKFEPTVAIRCAHHGNLDMLITEASNASGPFPVDHRLPFELQAEFAKEFNRGVEIFDNNSDIVHPFERHGSDLRAVVPIYKL